MVIAPLLKIAPPALAWLLWMLLARMVRSAPLL
jgi:hypothetical protein